MKDPLKKLEMVSNISGSDHIEVDTIAFGIGSRKVCWPDGYVLAWHGAGKKVGSVLDDEEWNAWGAMKNKSLGSFNFFMRASWTTKV